MIGEPGIPGGACSSSDHWFDQRECDRAGFFIQEFCRHVKGQARGLSGQPRRPRRPRVPGWVGPQHDHRPVGPGARVSRRGRGFTLLPFASCPGDTIRERQRRDRVDYGTWRERRLLIATDGNTVDHEAIRRKIHELVRVYRIRELLRWCAGNCHRGRRRCVRGYPADWQGPAGSIERIDLLVAALMGISRHLVAPSPIARQRRGSAPVGPERLPSSVPTRGSAMNCVRGRWQCARGVVGREIA